ncbi:MlaD family protein [Gordonia paraffinivorans]|uniref:MlaD family protein n=1 Tax=Gordonia paraffinivorans TaxID=175628 RepID=UPI00215ACF8F|nr:MlaD family protein [Gordonia paraffinivorans]
MKGFPKGQASTGPAASVVGPDRATKRRRGAMVLGTVAAMVAVAATVGLSVASARDVGPDMAGGDGFCADIPDTIGLYEGNPVTQMGMRVGKVEKIENRGTHVRVTFSLDPGRKYPADVKAVTRSKSLLADRSLELVGNYHGGPVLVEGGCIGVDNAFTPKSISEVAGSASDFLKALSDNGGDDLQKVLEGADRAFAGTGTQAAKMFENAARAAQNPDKFIADIGSSIRDMAPLTDAAIRNWDQIMSILNQAPNVTELGTTLFYDVARFCQGVGWTIALLYDIQRNYGDELWPILHGPVEDIIAHGAQRAPELKDLVGVTPSVAAAMREQVSASGALSIPYVAPKIALSKAQCKALGGACDQSKGGTTTVNPLTILLQKAGF